MSEQSKANFTEEQLEMLHLELMKLIISKRFFKRPKKEIADELAAMKNADGTLMFQLNGAVAHLRTFTRHISDFVEHWENAFAPMLRGKLMEKMVEASDKVHDSPQMMKVLTDKTMPQAAKHEIKHEAEIQLSAEFKALFAELGEIDLTQIPDDGGTGADRLLEGTGEEGHEVSLRGGAGPPRSAALEVVPQGDDRPIHVCGEDGKMDGAIIPDTKDVPEDDADNDRRDDMDSDKQP